MSKDNVDLTWKRITILQKMIRESMDPGRPGYDPRVKEAGRTSPVSSACWKTATAYSPSYKNTSVATCDTQQVSTEQECYLGVKDRDLQKLGYFGETREQGRPEKQWKIPPTLTWSPPRQAGDTSVGGTGTTSILTSSLTNSMVGSRGVCSYDSLIGTPSEYEPMEVRSNSSLDEYGSLLTPTPENGTEKVVTFSGVP